MERMTTKARGGAMAGWPLEMEITLIICMPMITRKYRLASFLLNCSNRFKGKNVNTVYLEVRTLLLRTSRLCRKLSKPSGLRSMQRILAEALLVSDYF